MTSIVRIAAAALMNASGQMLLVRKRGTTAFMLPGGKIEANEVATSALARELHEELGVILDPEALRYVGVFEAAAANELDTVVRADIYSGALSVSVAPGAEIDEVLWYPDSDKPGIELAALTRLHVLPAMGL